MGRYYSTNNHQGKFGFAIQDSSDPETFGMEEQEPNHITYYLEGTEESIENVKKVLDEQYDILNIKKEDRIYSFEKEKEIWGLLDKYHYKNWRAYDREKDGEQITWADDKIFEGVLPIKPEIPLAECRVSLGLKILDDLETDGYCELEAEL